MTPRRCWHSSSRSSQWPPVEDDGVDFLPDTAKAEVIREEDEYSGVRISMDARLASANLPFHVDVNVGDPIWPAPSTVEVPRLRGGAPIVLAGYPIHMVHAEKIVTAIQRGVANTRWRDFGDVWTLSRRHPISASDLAKRSTPSRLTAERNSGRWPKSSTGTPTWRRHAGLPGAGEATPITSLSLSPTFSMQ